MHAQMMDEYYAARAAQEARAEAWSLGYATELSEFYDTVEPRLTFKQWLVQNKRS